MNVFRKTFTTLLATCMLVAPAGFAAGDDDRGDHGDHNNNIKHILLISVDGMHALDLSNYVSAHPDSTLAFLSGHGVTYTNNATSSPSDSFPGLASLVTGRSPTTTGFWYDVTYNRGVSPPTQTTPFPITGGANLCPSVIGTPVAMDESLDFDLTKLDGGGGINANYAPRDPQTCQPILPHQYLRVNTIFEVVRAAGGRTAWVDKHPSYEWTNGPSGRGIQDFYGPEINSIPVPLPQYAGCNPVPFPDPGFDDGWTTDLNNIKCYDSLHVTAVLNQIDGFSHDRSSKPGIPTLFGMNFQAVSVGEKLAGAGYTDVLGTPSQGLEGEFDFVDQSLGQFVNELKKTGHYDSTLIIICAKHGQSPIDVQKLQPIGGGQPATLIGASEAFDISDDGSLIWLTSPSASLTASVVALLSNPQNQQTLGIQEIFAGQSLENKFNSPVNDPRTPDIILKVNTGVIFTGGSKIAEHGGLNEDDVHTALLVSFPSFSQQTVKTQTSNQQVAPTILKLLGLDPNQLQAVKKEQIKVLPFLFHDDNN